jgi:hypothetical protein
MTIGTEQIARFKPGENLPVYATVAGDISPGRFVTISGRNTKNAYVGAHTGAGLYSHGVSQRRAIAGVTDHRGGTELARRGAVARVRVRRRRRHRRPRQVRRHRSRHHPGRHRGHPRLRAAGSDRCRPDHRRRPHLMRGDHSMTKQRPFAGLTFGPEHVRGDRARFDALRALGAAPAMAGGAEANLTAQPDPFGVFVDADGRVVVDDFTNPISNIPAIVREFTRANQGYWIEEVFNAPAGPSRAAPSATRSAAPGDQFLPAGQLMPRAPGAEAPRLMGTRRRPIVAYPESLSGSIEVTDEARQRNLIIQVQDTFRQAANTFADAFQGLGEAALAGLVTASLAVRDRRRRHVRRLGRRDADLQLLVDRPRPAQEFARVRRLFQEDKGGVVPDTLVWTPQDAENFDRVYEDRGDAVLARYGITRTFTTVRRTPGNRCTWPPTRSARWRGRSRWATRSTPARGVASPTSTRWRGAWSSWPTAPTRSWK